MRKFCIVAFAVILALVVAWSAEHSNALKSLTGGTHHSLAIEMNTYSVLVDTANGDARAAAVIAKMKELIPRKPIRYIVAMHHHGEHLGGIPAAIDEGAIIVTHDTNKAFLERAANAPHTINPDRLAFSKKAIEASDYRI